MARTPGRKSLVVSPARGTETRAALLTAAVAALREEGFEGATAREIARRAGCNQSQIFYHYGSVADLLLAALDDVSDRRMASYRSMIEDAPTLVALVDSAQAIVAGDLASGDLRVLVELVTHAHVVPGLGPEVERRLSPWRALAETAVRKALGRLPLGVLAPTTALADALVAGLLGLELLENLSADRSRTGALFDRARALAMLVEGDQEPVSGESEEPR
jgi:AcrR family transcriptional regulator